MLSCRRAATLTLKRLVGARSRLPALKASPLAFIDPSTFNERHLACGQPGLFRELISKPDSPYRWPACEAWRGEGSSESKPLAGLRHLADLQGALVDVEVAPVGRGYGDGVSASSAERQSDSWSQIRMPFSLFHEAFIDGNIPWRAPGDATRMAGYVAQQDLFEVAPVLKEHCPPLPHTLAGKRGTTEQWRRNMWIGSAGTFTPLHCDPYENIFVQVVGTKRIHLFPPHARSALYLFGTTTRQPNTSSIPSEMPLLQAEAQGPPDEHDLTSWPLLEKLLRDDHAIGHHALLQPGDALYIPHGWFHCVTSLTPSASVNAWFR